MVSLALLPLLLLTTLLPPPTATDRRPRRQAVGAGQSCTDSSGATGTCNFALSCLLAARITAGSAAAQSPGAFDRSECGLSSGQQLVCCSADVAPTISKPTLPPFPSAPTFPTSLPFPSAATLPAAPAAGPPPEDHPNRRLLDDGPSCGESLDNRIVGGRLSACGRFPWLAVLDYTSPSRGGPTLKCGGALISARYVLTAAHCVSALPADYRLNSVQLGLVDLDGGDGCPPPQRFSAEEVLVHPHHHRPVLHRNDIALLRLDRAAVEGREAGVGRICLPLGERRRRDWIGRRLTVAGFGLTQHDGEPSRRLREVELPVLATAECRRRLGPLGQLGPGQMCVGGEPGRDSCRGDSGGPLMAADAPGAPFHVVGLVSFGPRRCGSSVPGVYTRVGDYVGWLLDNMRP